MTRYEFDIDTDFVYTEIQHWDKPSDDHCGTLVFNFLKEVNGLNRLVVFCEGKDEVSTKMDPGNKRLQSLYPFSAYAGFARFHPANIPPGCHVYGVWETNDDDEVTKLALQIHKPTDNLQPMRRIETAEMRPSKPEEPGRSR